MAEWLRRQTRIFPINFSDNGVYVKFRHLFSSEAQVQILLVSTLSLSFLFFLEKTFENKKIKVWTLWVFDVFFLYFLRMID